MRKIQVIAGGMVGLGVSQILVGMFRHGFTTEGVGMLIAVSALVVLAVARE